MQSRRPFPSFPTLPAPLGTLAPLAALVATGALLFALQDPVEVVIHPVAGNVSALDGQGGTIGLSVGADGVLMVDSQFEALAPRIDQAVRELAGEQPVFLVNTHWHGDHTGGNPHFGAEATIVAHQNVRRRLAKDGSIGGRLAETVRAEGLPVVTYEDGLSIFFNGEEVRLLHVPAAHTDGDTVVWFKGSNVVHMGDLYFQASYPFIDLDSGGSVEGLLAGLESVLAWLPADALLIAGHGEVTGVEGLREYRDMLVTLVGRVREALDAGLSAKEMIEGRLSADLDARWGGSSFVPPERMIQTLATDLARKR